jgi:DNA-binding CsgD family transcriptional regulator
MGLDVAAFDRGSSGGFVRAAEWRRVRDFTGGVVARAAPGALVVQGEAGAGKSTLWRAGVAVAEATGCRVVRSEPSAAEADSSFGALSDLLTGVLPGVAADIPTPQREALEVALLLRSAGEAPPTARAVGMGVLAVVRSCLAAGPLLVAVDDVQWVDPASLDALVFALRRVTVGPVSLVLTARVDAPADPLTAGAAPPPHGWRDLLAAVREAEEITLGPLDVWQIQKLLPGPVTARQARRVADQSRGNPFWAKEIAATLDSGQDSVPSLARALIERLARSVTVSTTEALAVVAAAGRIAVADALPMLDGLEVPAAALDAAVVAGVIVETEGRVTPAHPLIGAAALELVPPARRAQLYQWLAAAASNPERRAHFAALAAGPGAEPGVADALDAAAEAAHARAANASAGEFAAQAVRFTPGSDGAALVRRRIRAGELLLLAGEVERSLQHLEVLDTARLAIADLERALPTLVNVTAVAHGPAAATALVSRAVDATGPDPRRRALVFSLASDVTWGIPGGRRAAATEAISCAESAGAVANPSLHRALINLVTAKLSGGDGLDADLLERAERLEAGLSVQPLMYSADLHRGLWSHLIEDLGTARSALQRCITRARAADEDWGLAMLLTYLAATEELAGDYAAAAVALEECDDLADWHGWPLNPWRLRPRCELLIASGRLDEAVSLVDEHLPDRDDCPADERFVGALVRGQVAVWRSDADGVIRHLERAGWCADRCDWTDPGSRHRLDALLAEAYVSAGRTDEARRISTWLGDIGRRLERPALTGAAARIDALAAAAAGELRTAAEAARAAVAAHELSPVRLELARSLLSLGRIERRRRARGDSRAALRRALELATEMGHRPLLAQISQELPRVAAARAGTELTDAERRVADQIASGATNREAAAALFISVRTVDTHVTSIYRKLGVRRRSELRRLLSNR